MNILHIPNYYYPHIGGIEQTARDIVNSYKDLKVNQKVICFNTNKKTEIDYVDGVEVIRAGVNLFIARQSLSKYYNKLLKDLFKNFKPDLVIFHYPNPFVAHYLKKLLKKNNVKFILYYHADIVKQKILRNFFKGQTNYLLKRADKIVATSPNYVEGSKNLIKFKDKVTIIPSCINESRLMYNETHEKLAFEIKEEYKGKTILFAFGRHVKTKGLEYLIKASTLLNDDYRILIGGSGKLTSELKKMAKNDKKIKFLGRISDDELKATFLASDIFCFPSITKNEAFGLGLAEAMWYKLPSVTFTILGSGVNYVSINNKTGLEVANKDYKAYAKAIEKIKEDQELRNTLSLNAYDRCTSLFLYKTFKESIITLLKGVIDLD